MGKHHERKLEVRMARSSINGALRQARHSCRNGRGHGRYKRWGWDSEARGGNVESAREGQLEKKKEE